MSFKKIILLTGAGFTANYGGFLSREMWSKIFNNPKLNSAFSIKHALHDEFDFEKIYSDILDKRSSYPDNDIRIFTSVLNDAYLTQENSINDGFYEFNKYLENFLNYFPKKEEDNSTGICFTLNQDLFFEKKCSWQPLGPKSIQYDIDRWQHFIIDNDVPKIVPNPEEVTKYSQTLSIDFYFIKLHGSVNWITSDGKDCKVLGINKPETINNIPLLKWYFELFNQALNQMNTKLIIIGYSFNDDHINNCIWNAVDPDKKNNLKIFIISPEDQLVFYNRFIYKQDIYNNNGPQILKDPDKKRIDIWRAVQGYFPYKFSNIFSDRAGSNTRRMEFLNCLGMSA